MEARQGSNHERRWMVALMAVCLWVRERNLGMADEKDAEALRCHRQLVEEEEAAQKRQGNKSMRQKLKSTLGVQKMICQQQKHNKRRRRWGPGSLVKMQMKAQ
nr:uncharacterized protein LOC112748755 isoform X2 [Arachis hypogaea]